MTLVHLTTWLLAGVAVAPTVPRDAGPPVAGERVRLSLLPSGPTQTATVLEVDDEGMRVQWNGPHADPRPRLIPWRSLRTLEVARSQRPAGLHGAVVGAAAGAVMFGGPLMLLGDFAYLGYEGNPGPPNRTGERVVELAIGAAIGGLLGARAPTDRWHDVMPRRTLGLRVAPSRGGVRLAVSLAF